MKRILTCKNHPNLRWMTKPEAWTGFYNGARNIFFIGEPDHSKSKEFPFSEYFPNRENPIVRECPCSSKELILAPEDKENYPTGKSYCEV